MQHSTIPDFDVSDFAFDGIVAGYEGTLMDLHYLQYQLECLFQRQHHQQDQRLQLARLIVCGRTGEKKTELRRNQYNSNFTGNIDGFDNGKFDCRY